MKDSIRKDLATAAAIFAIILAASYIYGQVTKPTSDCIDCKCPEEK